MPELHIAGRPIGPDHPPYIIAEVSANHNGSLKTAISLIEEAKRAGADAVKLQTYTPDTITLNSSTTEFTIEEGLWANRTLYDLYQETHLPWEWHKPLFDHARKIGITVFSSPFDRSAVDFLAVLNAPAYKIASFEAIDLPLIRYAANTGKPLIISTGLASEEEIREAVTAAQAAGCSQLALLHCVSGYPAAPEEYNLRTIPDMISKFGLATGISDHTLGLTTAIASIALDACIIEKHFTLARADGGPDSTFSLEPHELRELCHSCRKAWLALGGINYGCKPSELPSIKFRRSLYFIKDMQAGDLITHDSIRSVRPGFGIAPKYYDEVVGARLLHDVQKNTPVKRGIYAPVQK